MTADGYTRVIAGRYRLGRRLGRGGMGTVWQATDELLGRQVAVKELHLDGDASGVPGVDAQQRRERALREARAVAQLVHPHVIVVHDVVADVNDSRPYIIMELIEGGSLADRIARSGPVDAAEAARIGLALLSALSAAHERGVLHRDLKPANVLLESDTGRIVLTDFGVARFSGATTLTDAGTFVGSPEYTAPERMEGMPAGSASDLWSLGVLLCVAMSGESPFYRDSLSGILCAVVHDEIRPPAAVGPLMPVVQGLLRRDPARRIGAQEAAALLLAHLATGIAPTVSATYRPSSWLQEPVAPSRPRAGRIRGALVAGILVVAMAGAVTATLLLDDDDAGGSGGGNGPTGGRTTIAPTRTVTSPPVTPPDGVPPATPRDDSSPAPTVTVTRTSPVGYRSVTDRQGFSIAVPEGFTRSTDDRRVFYISPDGALRIGIRRQPPAPGGPLVEMRRSAEAGPDSNPGYRDGKVTPTTHNGLTAALWEFTWNGFEAGDESRHTYDICWNEDGRMYDVWVSAPVSRQDEAKRHFDTALDSFTRG
ncbi:serine/threonine-protein kinase [Streptomyces sp. H27-C3]|uniref:serine/threonine-protein kinase n=1 Tax=Streptomyces sp. H27-C3 TaxID=3046305 RepID=UPI0024B9605D|nr:serine/threonine-protein kinase [Streptomyces sp. H27-C3]MDJ0466473.1 serine/threonine-protein kinase [Streptomyces sp. H27-C3]